MSTATRQTFSSEPSSAGAARRFLFDALTGQVDDDIVDDVVLLGSEVVSNAVLHARSAPTVEVHLGADAVRVVVEDDSPVLPLRKGYGVDATTARGLKILDSYATAWGAEPTDTGKIVWFEVSRTGGQADAPTTSDVGVAAAGADLENLLATLGFEDEEAPAEPAGPPPADAADLVQVRLLRLPVQHHHRTAAYVDELLREFAYLDAEASRTPAMLLELRDELEAQFSAFTAHPQAEFEAALAAGVPTIELVVELPRAAGPLSKLAMDLLDRADEFCLAGNYLLTLAASEDVVRYRRWFFGEFVRQCAGESPAPWPHAAN